MNIGVDIIRQIIFILYKSNEHANYNMDLTFLSFSIHSSFQKRKKHEEEDYSTHSSEKENLSSHLNHAIEK